MEASQRQLIRLGETNRQEVIVVVDGRNVGALEGDTLLTAVLVQAGRLRVSEFGDGSRAGFCLMGACQDCWMWTADGRRIRACTTFVAPGLSVLTYPKEGVWPLPE